MRATKLPYQVAVPTGRVRGMGERVSGAADGAGDSPLGEALRTLKELTKFWISVTSTLSAVTVYVLSKGGLGWGLLPLFLGVFLLAAGASALNEFQERTLDARMERTRNRPIPSGRVHPGAALVLAALFALAGSVVLAWGNNPAAGFLGLLAVLWYNGLYTPLKRVTAFAVVPGSVIGAIPPAIGWVAGGHSLLDARVLVLSFFFFIWQIPHFWLLLFKYGEDYHRAGFPSLAGVFSRSQMARLTFTWMTATAVSTMLLPLFGVVASPLTSVLLLSAATWMVWRSVSLVRAEAQPKVFRSAFMNINLLALCVMLLLALDPLVVFLSR